MEDFDDSLLDYALMEKTDRAFIVPASFPWDDLGD